MSAQNVVAAQPSGPSPLAKAREQVDKMEGQFKAALPAHIPVERFMRVVMTAVGGNPDLLAADRASLLEAALKAAQDGLIPDGRDGAMVVYNVKVKGREGERDQWIKKVQWMPMIAGVMKKVRNSGELSSIESHLVHLNDKFSYRIGIDDAPIHEPDWFGDRGDIIGVYAVAKLKDGSKVSEIMSIKQVEEVRAASRAANSGPWVTWWGEMARKTVLRRLSKRLPMSTDLDDLIRRDDALYDFDGAREEGKKITGGSLSDRMQALASPKAAQIENRSSLDSRMTDLRDRLPSGEQIDADTGEITEQQDRSPPTAKDTEEDGHDPRRDQPGASVSGTSGDDFPGDVAVDPIAAAKRRGEDDARRGVKRRGLPGDLRDEGREPEAEAWERGHDRVTSAGKDAA